MNTDLQKIKKLLKQTLKQKKISYEDLSTGLNLSQASVKRLLNGTDNITLTRLMDVCAFLEIDFHEFINNSRFLNSRPYQFSLEQEKILAQDFSLFLTFRALVLKKSIELIQRD